MHPVLRALAHDVERRDPQFARGLRVGVPMPPQEYRRDAARAIAIVGAVAQVGMLVFGFDAGVIATGVLILWAGHAQVPYAVRRVLSAR
jgi:hypothetical protein